MRHMKTTLFKMEKRSKRGDLGEAEKKKGQKLRGHISTQIKFSCPVEGGTEGL